MATADSVKSKINGLISKANDKTGKTDSTLTAAVDRLITGYGQGSGTGITPTGTIKITENGNYDVTSYANAEVDVPESVESTGNVEADNLEGLHYWEKYVSGSDRVTEASVSDVTLSYKSNVGTNQAFDTVKYSDGITVNDDALALVEPVTTILLDNTNRDQIVSKYIHTTYDGGYYRIPSDAKITYKTSTYASSVVADKAFKLTAEIGGEKLGIVVSANSAAYPEDGEQDGYRYVYMGTLSNTDGGDGTLPTLTNPGSATDLAEGKELIDGNGKIVTGTVKAYNTQVGWGDKVPSLNGSAVMLKTDTTTPYLFRNGFYLSSPLSNFGDATAEDVAAGKTFTSAAGLMLTGTGDGSGGGGLAMKTGTVSIDASISSFDIDTGLSTVDLITVIRSEVPSGESGTWGWMNSSAGDMTNYYSYGTAASFSFGHMQSNMTKNGDGSVTVKQYSASSPIVAGTYNWIAVGTA